MVGSVWFATQNLGRAKQSQDAKAPVDATGSPGEADSQARGARAGSPSTGRVVIGGVDRPLVDLADTLPGRSANSSNAEVNARIGRTPHLKPDENPSVALLAEALETGNHPERVVLTSLPEEFDEAAYRADPQAYLSLVEPGRVWQSAQPGPDVPALVAAGNRSHRMRQGESVRLRVIAQSDAPVVFTSMDLGAFSNRLPSITVVADENGLAEAVFTATPGTHNGVNILAASPLASGRVRFRVLVNIDKIPGEG